MELNKVGVLEKVPSVGKVWIYFVATPMCHRVKKT